jgi:inorganic pyrophosphatase
VVAEAPSAVPALVPLPLTLLPLPSLPFSDLQALHARMGEPVTDLEAADAIRTINRSGGNAITFEDFASYWQDSHPSLRKVWNAAEPSAIDAERQRKRDRYRARFKTLRARLPQGNFGNIFTEDEGVCPSLGYRLRFYYFDNERKQKLPISPWHDVPLRNGDDTFNAVIEIPKWSRRKFEIATGEAGNPIHIDTKNGVLREFTYGDLCFNYGAFPQTYEDPMWVSPDTGCAGDNDPLDLVEVGSRMWPTGAIVRVRPLGVLALIDDGETDWKIVCISEEDPLAEFLHDITDMDVYMPGMLDAIRRWFKFYKSPVINEFGFAGEFQGRAYAESIIDETHRHWKHLIGRSEAQTALEGGASSGGTSAATSVPGSPSSSAFAQPGSGRGGSPTGNGPAANGERSQLSLGRQSGLDLGPGLNPGLAISSSGLKRSSSRNALATLFGSASR